MKFRMILAFVILSIFSFSVCIGNQCRTPLQASNPTKFWVETIKHECIAPYNGNPGSYPIFRNVRDYGARGDGITDDTDAINAAISSGNRC